MLLCPGHSSWSEGDAEQARLWELASEGGDTMSSVQHFPK